eukprot:431450-Rhodomonas_salina.1
MDAKSFALTVESIKKYKALCRMTKDEVKELHEESMSAVPISDRLARYQDELIGIMVEVENANSWGGFTRKRNTMCVVVDLMLFFAKQKGETPLIGPHA